MSIFCTVSVEIVLCQFLLLLLLLYIMSDSVFHFILLLLYHLHFGSNGQNQEIIGKPHQTDLYQDDNFFDKMSEVCIILFQTMQK